MLRKLEKYSDADVTLNDEQHDEMCSVVERISNKDFDKIFLEGNEHGVGDLMKEIWYTDSKRQQQQFLQDQSKNGSYILFYCCLCFVIFLVTGAQGNRWSIITIRIGKPFYIYHLPLSTN